MPAPTLNERTPVSGVCSHVMGDRVEQFVAHLKDSKGASPPPRGSRLSSFSTRPFPHFRFAHRDSPHPSRGAQVT